jgi:hypothetical protein
MKQFKEFILEKRKYAVTRPGIASEWWYASRGAIPLAPSVLQDLERDITAYHVTDLKGLVSLAKGENKRRDISAFTKGSSDLAGGVNTAGGVLVKLKGKTSIIFDNDAYSALDRNGHRWIERLNTFKNTDKIFQTPMLKSIQSTYKKELEKTFLDNPGTEHKSSLEKLVKVGIYDEWYVVTKMVEGFSGKEKGMFIAFYMRESKKILGNKSTISSFVNLMTELLPGTDPYNEVLIHQYKIVNIYHYQTREYSNNEEDPTLDEVKEVSKSIGFRGKIVTKPAGFIAGIKP